MWAPDSAAHPVKSSIAGVTTSHRLRIRQHNGTAYGKLQRIES
jgi:hypothetical protein